MFIGVIWSAIWGVITGIIGGEWLGQGGTSTEDTPPQPLSRKPEGEVGRPVIAPKPFVSSGRDGIKVKTTPPTGENAPKIPDPPTIRAAGVWADIHDILAWPFPEIWEWVEGQPGTVPWLINKLRNRPPELIPQDPTTSNFKFGKLLTGNMSLEVLPRWEWTFAVDEQTQTDHHQESFEAYTYWLANQAEGIPLPSDYSGNFYDQGSLVWPLDPRDFSGGITMLFGARFLGELLANWWTRSLNYDAATLRGVIYFDIEITQSRATWERNYSEDGSEVDSLANTEGLALSLANIIFDYRVTQALQGETVVKPRIIVENGGLGGNSKLDKILAVKDFPFNVPISLLIEPGDLEGMSQAEIEERAYEKIESIPQLILWLTKALDELIGKFPITMEIGESDLLNLNDEFAAWKRKGKNPNPNLPFYLQDDKLISYRQEGKRIIKTVKVPNLAEAIAEIMGGGLAEGQRQGLAIELLSRCLLEIGSTKNVGVQTGAWVDAIADYLGFATKDRIAEVEYTYNPVIDKEKDGKSMARLLTPTKVLTSLPEYEDTQTMETHMGVMREIHAIVKTALTEGVGKTDGQLKQRLKDYAELLGIKTRETDRNGNPIPEGPDDFDQLLEKIERGFIDQPGITDQEKPYGREYELRPRIRRLTNPEE
jgi:hypothetical protein